MGNILRDTQFREIAETKLDSKNRVTLGKLPMKAHHYKIFVNQAGQIVLDPQLSIPAAEMWLFKNKKASEFMDNSIIAELDRKGFFAKLQ